MSTRPYDFDVRGSVDAADVQSDVHDALQPTLFDGASEPAFLLAPTSRIERNFAQQIKVDQNGCWIWTGDIRKNGYGIFYFAEMIGNAHRVSWHLSRGPIPDGLWVLHECDVRACVNPDHLYLGTYRDNTNDAVRRRRTRNANTGKTHCKNGHEFTPENTKVKPNAWTGRPFRNCRICVKANRRARFARTGE